MHTCGRVIGLTRPPPSEIPKNWDRKYRRYAYNTILSISKLHRNINSNIDNAVTEAVRRGSDYVV
ncbi:unnamed protein product [Callosobruchus maculatus]|uniref:Uncharacterized protein n=1 Tax=Callosobruchus maculatus TaxID=64391 RepID=A0A653CP65_CALMS|nr:unnamed protein product [Callosobruchus maculatus]